jgi:DNA-binding transcriptional LysR family regulator
MELRHLRSFVYVAETKSFSTAATRCCVTQSAVS